MVKPITYEQNSRTQGASTPANLRSTSVEHPLAGLRNISGLADSAIRKETQASELESARITGIDRLRIQMENDQVAEDAKSFAARASAKAGVELRTQLIQLEDSATGSAEGHTKKFMDIFDKYRQDVVSTAPNEISKRYLGARLDSIGSSLMEAAFNYEQTSRRAFRLSEFEMATDDVAKTVAMDPSSFTDSTIEQEELINQSDLPAKVKSDVVQMMYTKAATAYWVGEIARDPIAAERKLSLIPKPAVPKKKTPYDAIIDRESARFGMDANVIKAQLMAESGGNPNAVSPKGAVGVSQFMPDTAARYGIDPKVPEQAIKGQVAYMSDLVKMFDGDYEKALAGYNWGEGNVAKAVQTYGVNWKDHIPQETKDYLKKIFSMDMKVSGDSMSTDNVQVVTASPTLAYLTLEDRMQLWAKAKSESQRVSSDYRSRVVAKERDDTAAFMDGKTPPVLLTEDDYVAAFGADGLSRYNQYKFTEQIGKDIQSIMSMTEQEQSALLSTRAPVAGEGYASSSQRYEALTSAVVAVNNARQKDPILFAARAGIGSVAQLNPVDPNAFAESLNSRGGVGLTMHEKYGTPLAVLTNDEAKSFGALMDSMPTNQKMAYLKSMAKIIKNDKVYSALMQQIRPDSPVTAVAGSMLKSRNGVTVPRWGADDVITPDEAASRIVEGEALLNPIKSDKKSDGKPRIAMPPDNLLRQEWASYVGDAYRGTQSTGAEETAYQIFRSYYAGESGHQGKHDGQLDTDIARKAAIVASGGVTTIGGRDVLLPWGMTESEFKMSLADKWQSYKLGMAQYKGVDYDDVVWNVVGNGKYVPMAGTGPLRNVRGEPIVIDVNKGYMSNSRGELLDQIPTGNPVVPGNINLFNRPIVKNSDGTISTVRSFSVNLDGLEVLLPTVSDSGKILTEEEAIQQYKKTGKHLGKFRTVDEANAYAMELHKQQEEYYRSKK